MFVARCISLLLSLPLALARPKATVVYAPSGPAHWAGAGVEGPLTAGDGPALFVGGEADVTEFEGAIVDLTMKEAGSIADTNDAGFSRLRYSLKEWTSHFRKTVDFVNAQMAEGKSVLVHCFIGCKGAGSIAVAYLMTEKGLPFEVAYEAVRAVRPCVEQVMKPGHEAMLAELKGISKKDEL